MLRKISITIWFYLILLFIVQVYFYYHGSIVSRWTRELELQINIMRQDNEKLEIENAYIRSLQYTRKQAMALGYQDMKGSQLIYIHYK